VRWGWGQHDLRDRVGGAVSTPEFGAKDQRWFISICVDPGQLSTLTGGSR
jgi:hypothetical protein